MIIKINNTFYGVEECDETFLEAYKEMSENADSYYLYDGRIYQVYVNGVLRHSPSLIGISLNKEFHTNMFVTCEAPISKLTTFSWHQFVQKNISAPPKNCLSCKQLVISLGEANGLDESGFRQENKAAISCRCSLIKAGTSTVYIGTQKVALGSKSCYFLNEGEFEKDIQNTLAYYINHTCSFYEVNPVFYKEGK